jgi:hypothetical protein
MQSVPVEHKSINIPALVPSISSFETQLPPFSALQLQYSLREPVSLVSAYDVRREGSDFEDLCEEFKKSGVLLLDSGEYEHSHAVRYAGEGRAPAWTFDDFKSVCIKGLYDYVFSFDYFWCDQANDETPANFQARLLDQLFAGHEFISIDKLIPVVHLHVRGNDNKRLNEEDVLALVNEVATNCQSPFIAIPERELGDGLLERFRLAKRICDTLATSPASVGLHLLGCGNLLSFAFFAVAGVRMADGLEWYRTFVADNFHLHHFQHEPVIPSASAGTYNPTADLILGQELPYRLKTATMNLVSLQTFSSELLRRLQSRTVHELVRNVFGAKAGNELQELEE